VSDAAGANPKNARLPSLPSPSPRAALALEQAANAMAEAIGLYFCELSKEQREIFIIRAKCMVGFRLQYRDDPLSLLDCVRYCHDHDTPLPRWALGELATAQLARLPTRGDLASTPFRIILGTAVTTAALVILWFEALWRHCL
jgi:hypothetical protein